MILVSTFNNFEKTYEYWVSMHEKKIELILTKKILVNIAWENVHELSENYLRKKCGDNLQLGKHSLMLISILVII